MTVVYLGLGGNMGEPLSNLRGVVGRFGSLKDTSLIAVSRFYRTTPVGGPAGQSDYINAVAVIETEQSARALLAKCLSIEKEFGRVRAERWGPRTVDIDILLYGQQVINELSLVIPHPHLRERLFVLIPLCDVAPKGLRLPPDGLLLTDALRTAKEAPSGLEQGSVTIV